jgi:threonine/homoserine/homoserine lactone efflux protein
MLAEFALTALLVELTPGPNMTWLALLAASRGRAAALAAVAGIAVGLALAGIAAALGLSLLIAETPWLFQFLRWAGAVYLLWLAFDAWRDSRDSGALVEDDDGLRKYAMMGLLGNLLNPKAYLFYLAMTPAFLDASRPLLPQSLLLVAIYCAVATAVHGAIALLAGTWHRWTAEPARATLMRRIFAGLLVATAVWFLLATRTS